MHSASSPSSFLCTLVADGKGLAYHVSVSYRDTTHGAGIQFTSFVGAGRRSFTVRSVEGNLQSAINQTSELLCRIAIGQVVRDHLYDKAAEGDHLLDADALPWDGELRPVGGGNSAKPPRQHWAW
ncbi:hypothetical protein [Cupriavidus pauculus]|uniref:Uncharacterized protein n=1 Tax=Cupriavidus pauculus TaxID=82633 RepID=A0A2N5CDP5_9BURK|nr:hypothetical protein [Cupriavidus pauculus]PLQ00334.1 hypothetical protein CYJ10_11890 [Cupriavidus pauculus]